MSSNHSNLVFLFRTIPLAQLWSCTQPMLRGITWKTLMAKPPPLQTDENKQHISASEASGGPRGPFCQHLRRPVFGKRRSCCKLCGVDSSSLTRKQSAPKTNCCKSPEEFVWTATEGKTTSVGWFARFGVIGDPLQLHVWLPFEIKVCVFLRSGVKCVFVAVCWEVKIVALLFTCTSTWACVKCLLNLDRSELGGGEGGCWRCWRRRMFWGGVWGAKLGRRCRMMMGRRDSW